MTKYEKKVRERAEELAKIILGNSYKMLSEGARDTAINGCSDYARLTLQREAQAYAKGVRSAINDYRETELSSLDEEHINFELQSLGLVP